MFIRWIIFLWSCLSWMEEVFSLSWMLRNWVDCVTFNINISIYYCLNIVQQRCKTFCKLTSDYPSVMFPLDLFICYKLWKELFRNENLGSGVILKAFIGFVKRWLHKADYDWPALLLDSHFCWKLNEKMPSASVAQSKLDT